MISKTGLNRVLVTGATGYIGSNLVQHLIELGVDVHIVIRPNSDLTLLHDRLNSITVHEHDGTSTGLIKVLKNAQPMTVYHLASLFLAQHENEDIEALVKSNLLFPTQLLEAIIATGVEYFVNTGTSWQHYNNDEYNPVNLYAATKKAFEDILEYYVQAQNLKACTLQLFDTYGQNDPRQKLITLLWRTAKTNQPLLMSPGEQLIDLVHVDDVVRAFTLAAESLKNQSHAHTKYGVSSGNPIRLIDLIRIFEKSTNTSLPIIFGGRPYRPREVMDPWTNFQTVPNWIPTKEIKENIQNTEPP